MAEMGQNILQNLFSSMRLLLHQRLLSALQAFLTPTFNLLYSSYKPFQSQLTSKPPNKLKIPFASWDSHMHIVGDPEVFPLSRSAIYTPAQHCLADAIAIENSHGIPGNIVIVQPSIYGNDNSCLLDGLKRLNVMKVEPERGLLMPVYMGQGRGVVQIDPRDPPSPDILTEWHELGVRGVRVNIKSLGESSLLSSDFQELLISYAEIIRPLKWVLQLYIPLEMVPMLEEVMPQLDVCVCLDHFGGPTMPNLSPEKLVDPYTLPGFSSLINLLNQNWDSKMLYVKLSAPYRLSSAKTARDQAKDLEPIAMEILKAGGGSHAVYATDWPHTRFEGRVDADEFRDICLEWCDRVDGSGKLAENLFRENAIALWL